MKTLKIGSCVLLGFVLIGGAAAIAMAPVPASQELNLPMTSSIEVTSEAELLQDWEFTRMNNRCRFVGPSGF